MVTPQAAPRVERTCDGCTKCCHGHGRLWGEALGHNFQAGKPCFFVGEKGCSVYKDRPHDPCQTFKCEWLSQDYLPMWFRPDLSKVIVDKRQHEGREWLEVCEAGQKMDSAVLSWILIWAKNNNKNVLYQIEGNWNWMKNSES